MPGLIKSVRGPKNSTPGPIKNVRGGENVGSEKMSDQKNKRSETEKITGPKQNK